MLVEQQRFIRRYLLLMVLMVLGAAWMPSSVLAQIPIDPVFQTNFPGVGGIVYNNGIIILPNGKILTSGLGGANRLNSDGSLDATFTPYVAPGWVSSVAPLPNGSILAGTAGGTLVRLDVNGDIDSSFQTNAIMNNQITAIVPLANGKILVSAEAGIIVNGVGIGCLARLQSNGEVDMTFNTGGGGLNNRAFAIIPRQDGKIWIGGSFTSYNGVSRNGVALLNADGSLDESFTLSINPGQVNDMKMQVDGKIVTGSHNGNLLTRFNANGSIDTTFHFSTFNAQVQAVLIQPDGKIVAGGNFSNGGYCVRFMEDGTPDPTWDIGAGFSGDVIALAIQPNGQILAGGYFGAYNGSGAPQLARLGTTIEIVSGSAVYSDTTFVESAANNGQVSTMQAITVNGVNWSTLIPTGTALVQGQHFTASGVPSGLALVITKTTNTTATIAFTGAATAHENANDASVTLTFLNAAVASGNAAGVIGLTPKTLTIDFNDAPVLQPASASYSRTIFTEAASNVGILSLTASTATISITGATFVPTGVLAVGTDYTVSGIPAGLTLVLTRTSPTTLALSFTGAAANHAAIHSVNFGLSFLNGAVSNGNSVAILGLNRSLTVQFLDPQKALYSGLTFDESVKNDGSITTKQTITLTGTEFNKISFPSPLNASPFAFPVQFQTTGVPSGLTVSIVATSPTTAELSFTGFATAHAEANNSNVVVSFTNIAVTSGNVSGVQGLSPVTLSLRYRNPYTAAYSDTTFPESVANNGTITQTRTVTLSGDMFVTGSLIAGTHFTATGVPAGLTLAVNRTSDTTAQLAFIGAASAHENINDANVILTFLNAALVNSTTANSIVGLSPQTLTIDFNDNIQPASASYSRTIFTEAVSNVGILSPSASTATISITNATFIPTGVLAVGTDYTVSGVPAGLTLVLTRTSPTTLALSFTGAAENHAAINSVNFGLSFLNAAVSNGNAAAVTGLNRSLSVQFMNPYTATYSGLVFNESVKNDGTFPTKQTITLVGTSFNTPFFPSALSPSQYFFLGSNSLGGLVFSVIATSPTTAEISFTRQAYNHTTANNQDYTLTFTNAAVTSGNVTGVQGLTPVTLSLRYRNPYTAAYSGTTFSEAAANNGTITQTRTITLSGDTFVSGSLSSGTHFTATGVPAGLTLSLTRTSDTTAQIGFLGTAAAHAAANSGNVVLTFLNAAVVNSTTANSIVGLTPQTLNIIFQDPVVVPPPSSPNIVGFTPQVGTNGTVVTITGFGFTGTQNVLFGGAPAKSHTVVSDSVITAVVDYGSTGDVTVVNPQGFGILPGFTFVPRPTISSFTPTTGNQGQVVTINGANFRGTALNGTNWTTTSVYFGGTPATSFTVISATQIQATVGAGASGAVRVETLPGNVGTRTGFCYMAPLITSFAPLSASTGTQVVITGSNFTGATAVRFNGRAAASYTVVSDTQITAFPAAGTPLTGSVSVTTPQCTDDLATFTFIPAPVIYGFWLSGGTNGDVITIDGINFDNASAVKFGDTVAASYTIVSPTRITAVVGNGKTGAVSVIGPGGVGSRSKFIYFAPGAGRPNTPIITSFSPTQGPDGTVVTINGLNFQGTDWFTTAVRIGDAPDGPRTAIIQSMTATRLVVKINGGATGKIRVYTPSGVTTSTMSFTYFPPPTITSFTPTNGAAGTLVTITGTEFNSVSSVRFGGVAATSYTVVSPTQITAIVAAGNTGRVTVVANGGTATSATNFTFPTPPPAPTVTTFTPAIATTGTVITINGSNFTGATAVSFGGTPAQSFTIVNASRITAVVGAGASGAVQVTTPGGSANKTGFTYLPKPLPTITSFTPASASVGQTVTINGSYFTGATQVFMGSASVPFTVIHSSRITVVVPANAASGVIRVVTPNGVALRPGFTFVPTLAFNGKGTAETQASATTEERLAQVTSVRAFGADENGLMVFPNPAQSTVTVRTTLAQAATVRMTLVNVLGMVLWSQDISAQAGMLERSLELENVPSGMYMVELRSGAERRMKQVIKR